MGHEQGDDIDRQALRVVQPEPAVERGSERDAADDERHADEAEQPELEPARSGADRSERAGERRQPDGRLRAGGHRSPRSRRIRTWPICNSSPNPSGATPSTRLPLTYEPFVLPRSSMYQDRPR